MTPRRGKPWLRCHFLEASHTAEVKGHRGDGDPAHLRPGDPRWFLQDRTDPGTAAEQKAVSLREAAGERQT